MKNDTQLSQRHLLRWLPLLLGLFFLINASWTHIKAILAQQLLQNAWLQAQNGTNQPTPWPWADTWPVGRLKVPGAGIDQIVLSNASGRNLAFGPVHINPSNLPGETGHVVISGHRDTHFDFLSELVQGDMIVLEDLSGYSQYKVSFVEIIDLKQQQLQHRPERNRLTLVTCYPFDAIQSGTTQRYLVHANRLTQVST